MGLADHERRDLVLHMGTRIIGVMMPTIKLADNALDMASLATGGMLAAAQVVESCILLGMGKEPNTENGKIVQPVVLTILNRMTVNDPEVHRILMEKIQSHPELKKFC